tara:strand:- start:611 stop:1300 length:690 start_codon:yes stop_codon:yes gene_type:complete
MRAMILAAGLGKRMRPLTENTPKPLLKVDGKPLVEHLIEHLIAGGVTGVVINHHHLGEMIKNFLGDGSKFGIEILYSEEVDLLETGGGIINSLPKLKDESFIVVNADVWTDFDFNRLDYINAEQCLAHLVLVKNTKENPTGDFYINQSGLIHDAAGSESKCLTFSGISVLHRKLFEGYQTQPMSLVPLLKMAMGKNLVTGQVHDGVWIDVGTPQRLEQVNSLSSLSESK